MRSLLICFVLSFSIALQAQSWKPVNGTKDSRNHYTAFTNAKIFVEDAWLENATLLIHHDRIVEVGKKVKLPTNTRVVDLKGKMIYPSFIDLYSQFGIEEYKNTAVSKVQLESKNKGPFYWNEAIKPEVNAVELFQYNEKEAEKYRKMGFGTVLSHQQDGIMRGTAAVVALNEEDEKWIVLPEASSQYSFYKGKSHQTYPSSLMGIIALIRQAHYDALWYNQNPEGLDYNKSLEAINRQKKLPKIIDVGDELSTFRADTLGDALGMQFIIKTNGQSYEQIQAVKATNAPLIVPVNFPKPYDVSDPFDAQQLSLAKMKIWEMADENLNYLQTAGIHFSITADGIKTEKDFISNLKRAVDKGLTHNAAIAALTKSPAKMLSIDSLLGSLEKGKLANFIITSDTLFKEKTKIISNWVKGKEYLVSAKEPIEIVGSYSLNIEGGKQFDLDVISKNNQFSGKIAKKGKTEFELVKINVKENRISLSFKLEDLRYNLSGNISDAESRIWSGKTLMDGNWMPWGAIRKGRKTTELDSSETRSDSIGKITKKAKVLFPNMAYGWDSIPAAQPTIFRNVTVWTNEIHGIVKDQDVLIADGKILMMGFQINIGLHHPELLGKVVEIDGTGMHLTSGIIDEHSHIAISRGVNEIGQAVTAEVSISDVVNPKDINIYRQLSGGVTASQLLHGSANPIGGRAAMIKLRWGKTAEEMKIKDAPGFIKFALGENVKQTNWGDHQTVRFPQSRMGVEQTFYDAFIRAKEYKAEWTLYNARSKRQKKESQAPRRDIEMEVLVEILDSNRFISCHSYVQSEINMLLHVADSMGFTVNTFTHILEGYKVADKLRAHGAAASTFSDWWAYKFEVHDAIPYNGAILHKQGVLTAFNSDDAEMGRRLNQEAAKAVKYGGMSEEEAWKLVTLNPAKMLHLDHRMGSIKKGKDADLVLWTANPLSIYAKVQQTYVDGISYYDAERNQKMYKALLEERNRIIDLMLSEQKQGKETQKIEPQKQKLYDCDTVGK